MNRALKVDFKKVESLRCNDQEQRSVIQRKQKMGLNKENDIALLEGLVLSVF